MAKYRARVCPSCNYYVGYSVAKPPFKTDEVSVTSFCLNCSYKLPVHAIVRGASRVTSPLRRGLLRLATAPLTQKKTNVLDPQSRFDGAEKPMLPQSYARHLRAIGQDLERLRLANFNLECQGDAYAVWARSKSGGLDYGSPSLMRKGRFQKLWGNSAQPRTKGQDEHFSLFPLRRTKRFRYSLLDIDRIEQKRKGRRQSSGATDGHRFPQLLRTLGALVSQRSERLLAISWQDLSVSIVVETAQGQREIHVFRPDDLYGLWVKMYLRRNHRIFSENPR